MSDLRRYIGQRKARDPEFAEDFDSGYADFKIGVVLRQAREDAGLTRDQLAQKLHTRKSTISRIENHAEDSRLSTLKKLARALGKDIQIRVA
ncbi:MAG: helix-turn-helix transcriptional regulator [bacterium]|nr:helix-turn-helix transcriptional regulator [bacterium]